jgi:hypothetical protein
MSELDIQKLTSQLEGKEGSKGQENAELVLQSLPPQEAYKLGKQIMALNSKDVAAGQSAHNFVPVLNISGDEKNGIAELTRLKANDQGMYSGTPEKLIENNYQMTQLRQDFENRKFDDFGRKLKEIGDPVKAVEAAARVEKIVEMHKQLNPQGDYPSLQFKLQKGNDAKWGEGLTSSREFAIEIKDGVKLDWDMSKAHWSTDKEIYRTPKLTDTQFAKAKSAVPEGKVVAAGVDGFEIVDNVGKWAMEQGKQQEKPKQ